LSDLDSLLTEGKKGGTTKGEWGKRRRASTKDKYMGLHLRESILDPSEKEGEEKKSPKGGWERKGSMIIRHSSVHIE